MKKLFLLIAFAFISWSAGAQTWCPLGATWYYGVSNVQYDGYSILTYTNDSVINGISCKTLSHYYHGYNWTMTVSGYYPSLFTYEQGGVVYIYDNAYGLNKFDTLYNINAQIGDKWKIPFADTSCIDTFNLIHVINVGSRIINGTNLKWLNIKVNTRWGSTTNTIYDTIYEKMSLMNDFVYRMALTTCSYAAVDWDIYSFRCYTDNTFGNYSDYNGQCDYYYTGISEISNPTTITLSPNPATTTVTISISSFTANQQLIITDLLGREIERTTITNNQSIINVAQWNNGVYFYQLIDDKETKAGKFVVSH